MGVLLFCLHVHEFWVVVCLYMYMWMFVLMLICGCLFVLFVCSCVCLCVCVFVCWCVVLFVRQSGWVIDVWSVTLLYSSSLLASSRSSRMHVLWRYFCGATLLLWFIYDVQLQPFPLPCLAPRPLPPAPCVPSFCREGKSVAVVSDAGTPVRIFALVEPSALFAVYSRVEYRPKTYYWAALGTRPPRLK